MKSGSEKILNFEISKSVVINLGSGNLNEGFPRVTAQLWAAGHPLPEQFIGSLPAAPNLVELYKNWQLIYKNLCERVACGLAKRCEAQHVRQQSLSPSQEEDDELEIESSGITNVSVSSFNELCQNLQQSLNGWLKSQEFLSIERQLRSALDPAAEIRVIIETSDEELRRLPWHRWDFFGDYPKAEMALSRAEYKRWESLQHPTVNRKKVRILAILGNSSGIDLEKEANLLKSLQDAEVVFLVNPTRVEFNTQLWSDPGWDILFFAGHSQTFGETGRIYINENQTNNSLTIEQLEEALKAAIEKGLKLAIFNSCDGLGLASALEKLNIPQVIVMREPVPNLVAEEFFKHFLEAFAVERLPLYLAVQQARRKLQGLEDDFPGASWLPVICQNPAVEPPTWLKLGGIPPCPYRGLFAFREEDAHLFFGRERFQKDLVTAVKRKPLVAVVGCSGSGKSSVVFAGLIPWLRQDTNVRWQIVSFRPGNNPIEALAAALAPLVREKNGENEDARLIELELAIALRQDNKALYKLIESFVQATATRLVLIADQFEELYTQSLESERQPFLDALLTACSYAPAFTIVLTLRADFYGYALSYRPLSDALQGAVLNLGPMSGEELRSAIAQPAAHMQVGLEKGLTNKLINAVGEQPGRLPLLEFALTQLWSKQQSGLLTHQAYKEIGGVEEALANHAEAVYTQLTEADRIRAQRVFMQLVRLGEETEATRRLATRDEVGSLNWDLVTRLASNRLVVTNRNVFTEEETVEIVHEALIRSWGRLELWMRVDGEFRRWQDQLRAARRQWESSSNDEGALLRGKPLADAEYWQLKRLEELSSGERRYIELSLALRDKELKKQKRRRQLTISALVGGLVVTSILAGVAWWQRQNSVVREIQALSASSKALFATHSELDALRDAITAGRELQTLGGGKADSQRLVVKTLQQLLYKIKEYNRLSGHRDGVRAVYFSPDGSMIASASYDKTVKLWKSDGSLLTTLDGHGGAVFGVAFSPDGQIIVSASEDKTVKLWKSDGTLLRTLYGHNGEVHGLSFSPDGQIIASASWDKTVKLWKIDGTLLKTITVDGDVAEQTTVSFSPDGEMIASGGWGGTVKLWKSDGTLLKTLIVDKQGGEVYQVSFSPDGQMIATASDDKTVKLWKRDGSLLRTLTGHSDIVWGVSFSPDSQTLVSASQDRTVKLWKIDGSLLTTLSGHSDGVYGVSFSPNGQMVISGGGEGTVKLWKPDGTSLKTLQEFSSSVYGVSFSPDGSTLATASDDKTVKLWKRDGTLVKILGTHSDQVFGGVAFSPDGQMIASGGGEGVVKLWKPNGTFLKDLKEHDKHDLVHAVAFSPDSQMIASGSQDKTVKLWKIDGTLLKTFTGHKGIVLGVSFIPQGNAVSEAMPGGLLASASEDGMVKLWKIDGTLLRTLHGHRGAVNGVSFSPQGNAVSEAMPGGLIASAGEDGTVKLWKIDGTLLRTLHGHRGAVDGVSFSPNGQMIASWGWDKTVKLWKIDGTLLRTLDGHSDVVWNISFSPDGKTLASASKDKTVILWDLTRDLDLDELLVCGCNWARDYLKTNSNVSESDSLGDGFASGTLCDGIQVQ